MNLSIWLQHIIMFGLLKIDKVSSTVLPVGRKFGCITQKGTNKIVRNLIKQRPNIFDEEKESGVVCYFLYEIIN